MPGYGTGVGHTVGHGAKVGAIIHSTVAAQTSVEIRETLETLTELGIVGDDYGPPTCIRCFRVIDPDDPACPHCGATPDDELPDLDRDPDQEMLQDEDVPAHGPDADGDEEIPVELCLAERLQEILLEAGWTLDESEIGGLLLAGIWERVRPLKLDAIRQAIHESDEGTMQEQLLDDAMLARVLEMFHDIDESERRSPSAQASIRIARSDDGDWQVEVEDLLQDKMVMNRSGRVQLGEFSITVDRFWRIISERAQRLMLVGQTLLEHFRTPFFEADFDAARQALDTSALEQKQVARTAEVPESTFSRWCSRKHGGVWVATPHGVFHLGDFFRHAATSYKGGKLSTDAVLSLVLAAKAALGDAVPALGEPLNPQAYEAILTWLEGQDVQMKERTLRQYWKKARTAYTVAQAMGGNPAAPIQLDELRETLRANHHVDLDMDELTDYVALVHLCHDQLVDLLPPVSATQP